MYISRSDWREFVERLDAAERRAKENGYMVAAYQKELDLARVQVLAMEARVGVAEENYYILKDKLARLLETS